MAKDADWRTSAQRNRYQGVKKFGQTIKLEDLADYLQSECDAITVQMEQVLKESAEELKEKIKEDSPKDSGRYRLGWIVSKQSYASDYHANRAYASTHHALTVNYVVRNRWCPTLTHLLENGHDNPLTGKRTEGIPHIKDNADKAIRKCGDKIDNELKKG